MRNASVWQKLLGLTRTAAEEVVLDGETGAIVVKVRVTRGARGRCGRCRRRSPRYNADEGRRRWHALGVAS